MIHSIVTTQLSVTKIRSNPSPSDSLFEADDPSKPTHVHFTCQDEILVVDVVWVSLCVERMSTQIDDVCIAEDEVQVLVQFRVQVRSSRIVRLLRVNIRDVGNGRQTSLVSLSVLDQILEGSPRYVLPTLVTRQTVGVKDALEHFWAEAVLLELLVVVVESVLFVELFVGDVDAVVRAIRKLVRPVPWTKTGGTGGVRVDARVSQGNTVVEDLLVLEQFSAKHPIASRETAQVGVAGNETVGFGRVVGQERRVLAVSSTRWTDNEVLNGALDRLDPSRRICVSGSDQVTRHGEKTIR